VDEDNASRTASFLAGKYDLGWENPGIISRSDWLQIKDTLKSKRPGLRTLEFPATSGNHLSIARGSEAVQRPSGAAGDVHGPRPQGAHRRALRGRRHRQSAGSATALREWSLPVTELGEGAKNFGYDPKEARRLLAAAGYPNGFSGNVCWATYGSTIVVDHAQLVVKYLKDIGIDARLDTKEYGAYISTCFYGKFDSMAFGPQTPFLDGDNYLFGYYYPGEMKNQSHVNDPVVADMIVRQRRTLDPAKRREINPRHPALSRQAGLLHDSVGQVYTAVWDGALRNYGPNLGYDYAGRLVAAWLER